MTPEQIAGSSEHSQQAALICWVNQIGLALYPELKWLHAIPNGGVRDSITAGKLKAEGVKAGIPDLFLPVISGPYHGLYIEMKVMPNKPTKEQLDYKSFALENRFDWLCCYSWAEAKDCLIAYLELKRKIDNVSKPVSINAQIKF